MRIREQTRHMREVRIAKVKVKVKFKSLEFIAWFIWAVFASKIRSFLGNIAILGGCG
jgi:hypothetical protein